MNEREPLCARCAAQQQTCCQCRDVYVTLQDVQRIGALAGRADFWELRVPRNPDYLDVGDDPLWLERVVRVDCSRRVLRQEPSGDCCFLGRAGCRLPLEARPLVCRLHPLEYDERSIKSSLAGECPWHLLAPEQPKLSAISLSQADAERWHRQLYDEIRQEPRWAGGHRRLLPESAAAAVRKPALLAMPPTSCENHLP